MNTGMSINVAKFTHWLTAIASGTGMLQSNPTMVRKINGTAIQWIFLFKEF
jgi:hypothetical protein